MSHFFSKYQEKRLVQCLHYLLVRLNAIVSATSTSAGDSNSYYICAVKFIKYLHEMLVRVTKCDHQEIDVTTLINLYLRLRNPYRIKIQKISVCVSIVRIHP